KQQAGPTRRVTKPALLAAGRRTQVNNISTNLYIFTLAGRPSVLVQFACGIVALCFAKTAAQALTQGRKQELIMARRIRLPLLLVLACLTIAFVLKSTPAAAESPNCNDNVAGPHHSCSPIMGYQSSDCGTITFCAIGRTCWDWDCEYNEGGELVIV